MELMKRRLCLGITAKLENSKRQHCSRPKKKKRKKKKEQGPLFEKARKEKERIEKKKSHFCLHINCRSTSYAQRVEC